MFDFHPNSNHSHNLACVSREHAETQVMASCSQSDQELSDKVSMSNKVSASLFTRRLLVFRAPLRLRAGLGSQTQSESRNLIPRPRGFEPVHHFKGPPPPPTQRHMSTACKTRPLFEFQAVTCSKPPKRKLPRLTKCGEEWIA